MLKNLNVNTGNMPLAPVIQGANGVLYGTTSFGGNPDVLLGAGTVFQLNPDGSGFRVLKVFSQNGEGNSPHAGLWQAVDGTLYGTANSGGRGGNLDGTIFNLLPAAVLSTTVSGPGVEVRVEGLAGRTYRIQRSTTPTPAWADLGSVTIGSNGTGKLIDTTPPGSSVFYRTVEP